MECGNPLIYLKVWRRICLEDKGVSGWEKDDHMLGLPAVMEWAVVIIGLLATGGLVYWVIELVPNGRLIRCPETGAITFVEVGRASPGDGSEAKVTVQSCELWPGYYQCAGRCRAGQKWALWPKWGEVQIPGVGAKYGTSLVSSETLI